MTSVTLLPKLTLSYPREKNVDMLRFPLTGFRTDVI